MRRLILILHIIVLLTAAVSGVADAITVTANPASVPPNSNVQFTINSSFPVVAASTCTFNVNFGDGGQTVNVTRGVNVGGGNYVQTLNHSYSAPGIKTVTVQSTGCGITPQPLAPDPATTTVTVQCTPLNITTTTLPNGTLGQAYLQQIRTSGAVGGASFSLSGGSLPGGMSLSPSGIISGTPAAAGSYSFTAGVTDACQFSNRFVTQAFTLTVLPTPVQPSCPVLSIVSPPVIPVVGTAGQPYSYQIAASGGQPPIIFSLAGGSLPPGLNLGPAGMITGVPTSAGNYSFLVNASDSCQPVGQGSQQNFSIEIQPPSSLLSVAPIPAFIGIPRGRSSLSSVIYQFTGSPSFNDRLGSPSGSFIVGGEVIDVNPSSLIVTIVNGRGQISEAIVVPVRVVERALQRGVTNFVYERIFTDRSVSLISSVTFTITTDAGSDFAIRRIDLHFRDYRPETTVPRHFPNLKAYADISFVGSGLLKGYWEVDGGLLSYVEQHLTFGSQVTLQSPDIPPLPTFSGGTHIVRFVIMSPASSVDLPSISYFVTEQEYQTAYLKLIAPDEKPVPDDRPVRFEWEKSGRSVLYLIQFFKNKDDAEPFFSALTRDTQYQVPENVYREKFSTGNTYFWKVSGFDNDNTTIAESGFRKFSFK